MDYNEKKEKSDLAQQHSVEVPYISDPENNSTITRDEDANLGEGGVKRGLQERQ